jgi:hypothetical protein
VHGVRSSREKHGEAPASDAALGAQWRFTKQSECVGCNVMSRTKQATWCWGGAHGSWHDIETRSRIRRALVGGAWGMLGDLL